MKRKSFGLRAVYNIQSLTQCARAASEVMRAYSFEWIVILNIPKQGPVCSGNCSRGIRKSHIIAENIEYGVEKGIWTITDNHRERGF